MTEPNEISPRPAEPRPPRRRRRRWRIVLILLLLAIVVGWQVAKRALDVERYRPMVIAKIEERTGLTASVERLEPALVPRPSVRAYNVAVGEGDFRAAADEVAVYVRLSSLLRRRVEVTDLRIDGLAVNLPEAIDDIKTRFDTLTAAVKERAAGTGAKPSRSAIARVRAPRARIYLGDSTEPAAVWSVDAHDVMEPTIAVAVSGTAPRFGESARVRGDLVIRRDAGGVGVSGEAEVTRFDPRTVIDKEWLPAATVDAAGMIEAPSLGEISVALSGTAKPTGDGADALRPFAGPFTATVEWREGALAVHDIDWRAPGVEFAGNATRAADGAWAVAVAELTVPATGLEAALERARTESFLVTAQPDAALTAREVAVDMVPGAPARLARGVGSFRGMNVAATGPGAADTPLFAGLAGEFELHDGVFDFTSVSCPGLNLHGSVHPDFDAKSAHVALAGDVDATPERVRPFVPIAGIGDAAGAFEIERFAATFQAGAGLPNDLEVEGVLHSGRLGLAWPTWTDTLREIDASVRADTGTIDLTAVGRSDRLGLVSARGAYYVSTRTWRGSVTGDMSHMDLPVPREGWLAEAAPIALAGFGVSQFDLLVNLPAPDADALTLRFVRQGAPEARGTLTFARQESGWGLATADATGQVGAEAAAPLLPDGCTAAGIVTVAFECPYQEGRFSAQADLTPCSITLGRWIDKRPGDSASVAVVGSGGVEPWRAESLTATYRAQSVAGRFEGERFRIDAFDVGLDSCASLLADGAETGGRVTGAIATNPTELTLNLAEAGLRVPPAGAAPGAAPIGIDAATGRIQYRGGQWVCENLAVRGANSDVVVTASNTGNRWQGALRGRQLDLDAVDALIEFFKAEEAGPAAAEPAHEEPAPYSARIPVALDALLYRRARFNGVKATVIADQGGLHADDLVVQAESGTVTGTMNLVYSQPDRPGTLAMDLQLAAVGAKLIDELAFTTPRNLTGTLNGTVNLELGAGEDVDPFQQANGQIAFTAKDGSLGQLGLATKILTILRTTEIVRLRMPTLRDEGLVYDTCTGKGTITNGVLTVEEVNLQSVSYEMRVTGTVDFPKWQCELLVVFNPLETVTSVAGHVPVVGEAVDAIAKLGGLSFLATGPPDDPKVAFVGGPVRNITDEVRNAAKSGSGLLLEGLKGLAEEALGELLPK
ncbi:MAG: AsmA-like C-terminal region-containing protein [Candidatus Hydrogenedentes bacterium]|nr:AsmA-like C-terminal region-containing protein [Candidatus Hydrogenedentota bacterium]